MPKKSSNLSLIIPCYNEENNLPHLFDKILKIQVECYEIILVDNGSTDDTSKKIENFIKNYDCSTKLLKIKTNIGYGHGIISGVKKASGQIIAWTHADLQTDLQDVINAYQLFISNTQNRSFVLKGKRIRRNLFDSIFTNFMSTISSVAFNLKLSDVNAQPKMFPREFCKYLNNAPNDFALDLFFLVQALKNDYDVIDFPVTFKDRSYGISKGGGSILGKLKLSLRTLSYIYKLRYSLKK